MLIGNSMGAGAAAWAAAESPADVAGLVLIGLYLRNPPVSFLEMLAFRLALVQPWGYAAWKTYYASLYPGRGPEDLAQHQARIQESLRRPGRGAPLSARPTRPTRRWKRDSATSGSRR